ncbi:hypothetical protein GCM10027075_77610 [Streptomyces heilongjiangensis]
MTPTASHHLVPGYRWAPDLSARSGSASPPEAGPCPVPGANRCGFLLATPPLCSGATGSALAQTHGGLLRTPPPMAWEPTCFPVPTALTT